MEPTISTTDEPSADQMAEIQSILAKHAEDPGDGDNEDPGDEAVAEAQSESEEQTDADEPQAEEGADTGTDPEVAEDEADPLEEVYSALQRDGWRLSELKGLAKTALVRMGKAAIKRQTDIDAKLHSTSAELAALKKQMESAGKSEAEPGTESPGHPATATLSGIAKRFAEVSGIEERDAEPILSELGHAFTAPLRKELEASSNAVQALGAMLDELVFERVQDGLVDRFPQIKTDEGVSQIKKQLKRLNPAAYSDLSYRERARAMVEDAAGLAFKSAEAPTPKPKVAPKRNQPSLPGARTKTHRSNPEADAYDIWRSLEKKHGVA